jgi:hypothetical protein
MTPQQDFITAYIARNRDRKSRYDIDKTLLERGYSPEILDIIWRNIEVPTVKSRKKTQRSFLFRLFQVLLIIWLGSWLFWFLQGIFGSRSLLHTVWIIPVGLCPFIFLSVYWYIRIRVDNTVTKAGKILALPFFFGISCFFVGLMAAFSYSFFRIY